jgi:UDP-glucose 4-epimerase
MRVLVTGGAGYIGSHMVKTLLDRGHHVVVLDDLSTGHRDAVLPAARFVAGDVANGDDVRALVRDERIEAVIHFAAKIRVEESVADPRLYWNRNLVATLALLDAVLAKPMPFVFSSTAAVYGTPESSPIDEAHPKKPVSPYGDTKLAIELALAAYGSAFRLPWMALRYFNAAGADPAAGLGERHEPESHLVPIVLDVALGKRAKVSLYGTDWPTTDGSCVRDYVHVLDLCEAHLAAIEHLARGGENGALNLGTGRGHSVREVIAAVERVSGRSVTVEPAPRRAGDPAELVAKVDRAAAILGWRAKRASLESIVGDAWAFASRKT